MDGEMTAKHGGNIYAAIRDGGGGFADFLDFSANINPLGLSPCVRQALLESLDTVTGYPDPDALELRQAIAATYQTPLEWIETGNGAVELIYLLCRALSPRRVAVPAPTFSEYEAAAQAAGVPCDRIPQFLFVFQPLLQFRQTAIFQFRQSVQVIGPLGGFHIVADRFDLFF